MPILILLSKFIGSLSQRYVHTDIDSYVRSRWEGNVAVDEDWL